MDNLIFSNDCTCAEYYKINNIQYNHPFMWVYFPPEDYLNFIKLYNDINLNNYKCSIIEEHTKFDRCPQIKINKSKIFKIELEFNICVAFPHYILNKNYEGFKDKNYFSPNIIDYIKEKYNERLNRFDKKIKPIFLFNEKEYSLKEDILNFINITTPYKKIIYTSYKDLLKYNNDNIIVIYKNNIHYSDSFISFAKEINNYL